MTIRRLSASVIHHPLGFRHTRRGSPCPSDRMTTMPRIRDLRQAAKTLRLIVEATKGLPDETPRDLGLQDRLDLAANFLDAAAKPVRRFD